MHGDTLAIANCLGVLTKISGQLQMNLGVYYLFLYWYDGKLDKKKMMYDALNSTKNYLKKILENKKVTIVHVSFEIV